MADQELLGQIYRKAKDRGGFTKSEIQYLEAEGFLDGIKKIEDMVIEPDKPDEYYEALERDEAATVEALKSLNIERYGEEDPPARGMPFRWEFKGVSPKDKKQYRKIHGYPKAKVKDLERGPDQFFDIFASKRMT
tara:strand:+ start:408 stop:812 length:405 start_codon:yes stop_codon:yes gene_type:complete